MFIWKIDFADIRNIVEKQGELVVKTSIYRSESPRFDLRQYPFVQLS